MEYDLLGPLEVRRGGQCVDLGSRKQRALLAVLLLERGRTVSVDRIVDALWGDEPPPRALASVQSYVSNLRRVLEPGRPAAEAAVLVTAPPGYLLATTADEVDLDRVVSGAARARAALDAREWAQAAVSAAEVLERFRGPLLADLADEPWVQPEAARAEELRSSCREVLATARLDQGHSREALALAQRLVEDEPFRERAWELLVLALHRSGRSVDALERYRTYARRLDDELGLEPGRGLQELHTAVLRQDPALEAWPGPGVPAPRTAGPTAEPPGSNLVGRAPELAAVDRHLAAGPTAGVRWVVLTGPPGIGKTRLAEEVAALAAATGAREVWARCHDEEGVPAWWPLRQVVRALGEDPDALLLPPAGGDADAARFVVYERLVELLRTAARTGPLVVVVDDVQWADPTSLRTLAYLCTHLRSSPLTVVLTMRDGERRDEAHTSLLSSLTRCGASLEVDVPPLGLDDVTALLRSVAGEPVSADEAFLLAGRTAGNPLFVAEYARLPREERLGAELPVAVRHVLDRRLDRLPPPVLGVLSTAAVLGDVFDVDLLAAAAHVDADELDDLLDVASEQRIVGPARGAAGYAFAHGLLRDAVLARLSPLRRQRLEARVADALQARPDVPDAVPRRARHLLAALPLVDAGRVFAACVEAARDAEARTAVEAAAEWWQRALQVHASLPPSVATEPSRDDVVVARVAALARAGRGQTVLDVLDEALLEAVRDRRVATVGRLAAVLLRTSGGWPWASYAEDPAPLLRHLPAALEAVEGEAAATVRVLSALAAGLHYEGTAEQLDGLTDRAIRLAEELGDPAVLADALVGRVMAHVGAADRAQEAVALLDRLAGLRHPHAEVDQVMRHSVLTMVRTTLGDVAGARRHYATGVALADAHDLPILRVQLRWFEAVLAQWDGDLERAEGLIERAVQLHSQTELYNVTSVGAMCRLWLAGDRGALATTRAVQDAAVQHEVWAAATAAAEGDERRAEQVLRRTVGRCEEPLRWFSLSVQTLLGHLVVDLHLDDLAGAALDALRPYEGLLANAGQVGIAGPVDLALGRLHALRGEHEQSRRLLEQARALAEREGGTRWAARATAALEGLAVRS